METTKKEPVDVAAIIARANETKLKAKTSTEKIEAVKDTYRILPEYPKYEFNGVIIRSVDKKSVLSFKTGTQKYQLCHKDGTRRLVSKDEIKAMFPAEEKTIKPAKVNIEKVVKVKAEKVKKEKPAKVVKEKKVREVKTDLSPKEIEALKKEQEYILISDAKKHKKMLLLSQNKVSNKEIAALLETNVGHVWNELNRYKLNPDRK